MKKYTKYLSFFSVVTAVFLVWVVFFDENNMISQVRLWNNYQEESSKNEYLKQKVEEAEHTNESFQNNPEKQERYARENFFMKKEGEDVYYISEEE
jgi:cell division protein FtsB